MIYKALPDTPPQYAYPAALVVIVALCGVVYARFKMRGWL
jgi:Mg2+ and Co2+ transporter CorA